LTLCAAGLGGFVGRAFIRVEMVNTLFIAHHYRIRDRRYLGCIGGIFEHNSDY
jgi:hypothetical protein